MNERNFKEIASARPAPPPELTTKKLHLSKSAPDSIIRQVSWHRGPESALISTCVPKYAENSNYTPATSAIIKHADSCLSQTWHFVDILSVMALQSFRQCAPAFKCQIRCY